MATSITSIGIPRTGQQGSEAQPGTEAHAPKQPIVDDGTVNFADQKNTVYFTIPNRLRNVGANLAALVALGGVATVGCQGKMDVLPGVGAVPQTAIGLGLTAVAFVAGKFFHSMPRVQAFSLEKD